MKRRGLRLPYGIREVSFQNENGPSASAIKSDRRTRRSCYDRNALNSYARGIGDLRLLAIVHIAGVVFRIRDHTGRCEAAVSGQPDQRDLDVSGWTNASEAAVSRVHSDRRIPDARRRNQYVNHRLQRRAEPRLGGRCADELVSGPAQEIRNYISDHQSHSSFAAHSNSQLSRQYVYAW